MRAGSTRRSCKRTRTIGEPGFSSRGSTACSASSPATASETLERPGLSASARHVIEALQGMVEYPTPLDGNEADWDIEALRARGGNETYSSWWETRGKAATKAGLYGVASACLEEAERREPNGAYWDPPSWTHSLPATAGEPFWISCETRSRRRPAEASLAHGGPPLTASRCPRSSRASSFAAPRPWWPRRRAAASRQKGFRP